MTSIRNAIDTIAGEDPRGKAAFYGTIRGVLVLVAAGLVIALAVWLAWSVTIGKDNRDRRAAEAMQELDHELDLLRYGG